MGLDLERLRRALRPAWRFTATWAERAWGVASLLVALALLGRGGFAPRVLGAPLPAAIAVGTGLLLGLVVLLRGRRLWHRAAALVQQGGESTAAVTQARTRARLQLEAGGALLTLGYALLQAAGGAHSPLAPLRYALCAVLLSLYRGRLALVLTALALTCEALLLVAAGVHEPIAYLLAGALVAVFCALHFAVLRGELWRQRDAHKRHVADAIAALQKQARDFRLLLPQVASSAAAARALSSSSGDHAPPGATAPRDRADEEGLLLRSAVVMVRQNLDALVGLLKRALGLRTCALLWLPADSAQLQFVAVSTDSAAFNERPIGLDMGVVGTVVKRQQALALTAPKPALLPYYDERLLVGEGVAITAFLGVPLYEDGKLCGVLCADRGLPIADAAAAPGFTAAEEALLLLAVPLIVRGLQSERVFAAVERSQYEHERLYEASRLLNRALTPEQVHQTAFAAVGEICRFDFAALTHHDPVSGRHTVIAAAGDEALTAASLERTFPDNAGLCAMVVKNRAALPPGGEIRDRTAGVPVFDDKTRLQGCESLIVLPLLYNESAAGTLVVASRAPNLFTKDRLDILHVLANQIAVSLDNARMYQAVEAMATTDALTGLCNRRSFQERLAEMLRRAERHHRPLTLILSDIDHFKKINDTYGHLVGDAVLKRVAQVVGRGRAQGRHRGALRRGGVRGRARGDRWRGRPAARGADPPGSPEAAACPPMGWLLAAPCRSAWRPFRPMGGTSASCLQRADQALYYAKRHGRNQAVALWRRRGRAADRGLIERFRLGRVRERC